MEKLKDKRQVLLKSIDDDCDKLESIIKLLEEEVNDLRKNCKKKEIILNSLVDLVTSK